MLTATLNAVAQAYLDLSTNLATPYVVKIGYFGLSLIKFL